MKNDRLEILDFTIYHGRNIYSHRPVMKMLVDIGDYNDTPTKDIEGFNDRLLAAFPGLKTNCCGLGYVGGFLERLNSGTYLGHVLEHVILEMQFMIGYDVSFGKTRMVEEGSSKYNLVYEYQNEVCVLECSKAAVFILNCFIIGKDVDVDKLIAYLKRVSIKAELGPSTSAIVNEAKSRGIPITRIGSDSLVRLGYGKNSRLIESTLTDATSCICADISSNKQLTKMILSENKIKVPYGKVVYSELSAVYAANNIGYPVVIKPFDGNQGKGVFLNLNTEEAVKDAFKEASKLSAGIIVEKYITGRDYRVLVVGNKVSAVCERIPALVIGDGVSTIKELVDMVNSDEKRGEDHEKALTKIKLDTIALNILEKNGMTIDYVPKKGETVKLRENGNISTGGTASDCTDIIHPDNSELAIQAANAIGIDIAGIDFVTEDISKSLYDTDGAIVEVNTAPGIRMHLYPSKGMPRSVAKDILDLLFPSEELYTFPLVSVTGTNGKTTTVRLINHVLTIAGKTVGMTSTSGTFIGEKCVCRGDNSGPQSAKSLLANKKIDSAVLETARGGIIRDGLGYDLADVGVITNISDDHLGVDGINSLDDLAFVKALVVEAVKKDGYAVLNADDDMTANILEKVKAKIILFSRDKEAAQAYSKWRFIHVFIEDGCIVVNDNNNYHKIICVPDIPITWNGINECNIENSLAAVSALYALKVSNDTIAEGLKTFKYNKGRFNLFAVNDYKVMLDYGHNRSGYEHVLKTCKNLGYNRLIGVIGMPGDRMDCSIRSVGELCSNSFDYILIKEDKDLRGRKKNEVADILYSATSKNLKKDKLHIVLDELEALNQAMSVAQKDDLIVMFYEDLDPLIDFLNSVNAVDLVRPSEAVRAV